jgi:hypothetical protein
VRVVNRDIVACTVCVHLDFAPEDEELVLDREGEFHLWAGVGAQNGGYWASGAIARFPGQRIGICLLQAAFLDVAPAMKVLIVVTAFMPGRCLHGFVTFLSRINPLTIAQPRLVEVAKFGRKVSNLGIRLEL